MKKISYVISRDEKKEDERWRYELLGKIRLGSKRGLSYVEVVIYVDDEIATLVKLKHPFAEIS